MVKISFIVCTYNSPELVKRCLDSILRQNFKGKIEIILCDGGSDRETLELIDSYLKKYKFIKFLHNKSRLPEGHGNGKWLAYQSAKGEYIAIVDQDNELQGSNWINDILLSFDKNDIIGCASKAVVKHSDSLTNQYIALIGTDPVFVYRSVEGLINLKQIGEESDIDTLITLDKNYMLITGGNCFVYKKEYLDKIHGYVQDTENIARIVNLGFNKVAISKIARTHHFATKGFFDFIKKKKKWARVYDKSKNKDYVFSYFPSNRIERKGLIVNAAMLVSFFPSFFISVYKFAEDNETAWLLHAPLGFITGFIYFFYTFTKMLKN